MNAHDRLRLYLEQRRELGESELVLDGLPVEAVLKMIGAPAGKGAPTRTSGAPATSAESRPQTNEREEERARFSNSGSIDNTHTPSDLSAPSDEKLLPSSVQPTDPAPRFNSTATTDWRAALSDLAPGADQKAAQRANNVGERRLTSDVALPGSANVDDARSVSNVLPSDASKPPAQIIVSSSDLPAWLMNLGIPSGLKANAPGESRTSAAANACQSLDELAQVIAGCRACALGASATHPVPGEGKSNADFVCVGEAPGQTEDETGRPFVGAAGALLTKILGAIQLPREEVFICNVLKHRPPGNRNPAPDEIDACTPYLTRQLALIQPKVILALGTFAAQTLLNTTTTLGKLRGQVHRYNGVPLIVTYHPAALLRNEHWKRPTWDDVKLARKILDAARLDASRAASPAS